MHTGNSDLADKAKRILEKTGATDISTNGEVTADRTKTYRPDTVDSKRF